MSLKNPVRYPVKHYSHLDVGAPQLANIDGNIKTIIKACLVTGIGAKVGAGWTSLFEDAFRIVLRRPLRTGNPPDIKIENGVINGVASHRIVSQDNPTGLDDINQLAAVNLLARDSSPGNEWHLIASDFGFVLCYQMGDGGTAKNHMLYCGSMKKMQDADSDFFIANTSKSIAVNGTGGYFVEPLLSPDNDFKDMRTGVSYKNKQIITVDKPERYFNNDYLAQQIMVEDKASIPFYCSILKNSENSITKIVSIESRSMLRYVNKLYSTIWVRSFYIPLDYWEL